MVFFILSELNGFIIIILAGYDDIHMYQLKITRRVRTEVNGQPYIYQFNRYVGYASMRQLNDTHNLQK